MIMTNIDHHGILIFDGIDYCDFHYHGITIISIIIILLLVPIMGSIKINGCI